MTLFYRLVSPIVTTFTVLTVLFALSMCANVTFAATGGVVRSDTVSRSGPGNDYYETSRLYSGDRIEIYHEADNGWLAIRPPIGSFSWVGAEYVDVAANGVGTITAEGLASRIGSEFSDQCQAVSVRLHRGEKVSVVDRIETPENPACKVWLKILPPSGEFRWIRKEDVEVSQQPAVVKTSTYQTNQTATIRNVAIGNVTVDDNVNGISKATYQTEAPVPTAVPPTSLPVVSPSTKPLVAMLDTTSLTPEEEFKRVFEELRLEARMVMTRPTEDWVFDELIKRGNELATITPNDYDRQKVQHLTEALRRTQSIRREITSKRQLTGTPAPAYQPLPVIAVPPVVTPPLTQPVASNYVTPTIPSTKQQPTFDQVGRLGRFKPVPTGHPPYALTNERGEVICLITPDPTLDIDALTGQWVGVTGELGEYTKTGKPSQRHITVNGATMLTQGN